MKAKTTVHLEKDEWPDKHEQGKQRLREFLEKKLQKELSNNDVEDFELLDEPKIGEIKEVDSE